MPNVPDSRRKATINILASVIIGEVWLWALTRDLWYLADPWLWFNAAFISVVIIGWFCWSLVLLINKGEHDR